MKMQQQQMQALVQSLSKPGLPSQASPASSFHPSVPTFCDSTTELWKDYWALFKTFAGANSMPEDKLAQVGCRRRLLLAPPAS
jgi:hypothetical protein